MSANTTPHRCPFQGSIVALPTPFNAGRLDLEAFEEMVDYHAEHATQGVVVAGTTGESATLSDDERSVLFEAAVRTARHRLPVIAGVGTNCTKKTIELAQRAALCGVDGTLVVTPYYNQPSQRGLLLHFGQLAEATDLPIILYNVPSRTNVDLEIETVTELARRYPRVVAIKEAKPCLERARVLIESSGLAVFCGSDELIADFALLGAAGAVGVIANIVPEEVAELLRTAGPGGDELRAAELVELLAPLARDLFIEVNPVPVKAALARMKRCYDEVRSPLTPLEEGNRARLETTLRASGLVTELT